MTAPTPPSTTGRPAADRPGTVSPGAVSPGGGEPGGGESRYREPGGGEPRYGEPGAVSPGTVSPGAVSPGTVSPGTVSPGMVSPGAVSPGTVSPGAVSPGTVNPGASAGATMLDELLAQGHLADIDRHFATLMAELDGGGGPELALAAALASAWARDGHACIALHEVAGREWPRAGAPRLPDLDAWIGVLAASPVVAGPADAARRPLVLDGRNRLYLERLWSAERTVAADLRRLADGTARAPDAEFGAAGTESTPGTEFGAAGTGSTPGVEFGAAGTGSTPGPEFGAAGTESTPGPEFGAAGTESTPGAEFGAAGTESTPGAEFGAAGTGSTPGAEFGAAGTESTLDAEFGAAGTESTLDAEFGAAGMESTPGAEFGAAGTESTLGAEFGAAGMESTPGAEIGTDDAESSSGTESVQGAGADAERDGHRIAAGGASGLTERPAGLEAALDRLFPDAVSGDRARIAARTAVCRRLCVVSGGPGTGKTTTAAAIVALLIELRLAAPGRIALAAPTGKAAARLQEAVRGRHRDLVSRVPALEGYEAHATTVHRWLFSRARSRRPVDALVLDEGSMVDLTLMAKVLAALPDGARLVMLGDASQLASVQPGAVFADVCRAGTDAGTSPLAPCVVELVHNWRFDAAGGIGRLAGAVVRGDAAAAVAALQDPSDDATELRSLADAGRFERLATTLADGRFAPALEAAQAMRGPGEGIGPLSSFRVLCAHRVGAFGAERFNQSVERRLRALGLVPAHDAFYPGRPILVTRNDPRTGLSNGDTGIVLRDADGRIQVWFPELEDAEGRPRLVSPARLPPHESFFAVTVHRAQGSEYDEIAVVPGPAESRVATRELLYTAVTRARRRVVVYGTAQSVGAAVERGTQRSSGLRDALVKPALATWTP